jgi:hypothetical protein
LPFLPPIEGELALERGQFEVAQKHFREALRLYSNRPDLALALGWAIVANKVDAGRRGTQLEALVDQFPDNGPLVCLYAIALRKTIGWPPRVDNSVAPALWARTRPKSFHPGSCLRSRGPQPLGFCCKLLAGRCLASRRCTPLS